MERALDLELLAGALAGRAGLPDARELQRLMADVEVQLFVRQAEIPQELLDAAWYLHAVASVDQARQRYTLARQRQAFLVSAHIFDLALSQDGHPLLDRLSFGFAAAIGYRRGGRDPNATAIMNRLRSDLDTASPVLDHSGSLALEAGLAFLGFETRTLFTWLAAWRRQLAGLARASQLSDLTSTAFGATHLVVVGASDLLEYFARGNAGLLDRGRERLRTAAAGQAGPGDLNARAAAARPRPGPRGVHDRQPAGADLVGAPARAADRIPVTVRPLGPAHGPGRAHQQRQDPDRPAAGGGVPGSRRPRCLLRRADAEPVP